MSRTFAGMLQSALGFCALMTSLGCQPPAASPSAAPNAEKKLAAEPAPPPKATESGSKRIADAPPVASSEPTQPLAETPAQIPAVETQTTVATSQAAPAEQEAKPEVKPAAKAAEPPLDESVDVDALLAARLPADMLDLGWIRLFDGQSLMGWKSTGNADWHIENGEIVATTGDACFLMTDVRFSDYEIELEYLAAENTNSGIFLRTADAPTDPAKDCFELNIAPTENPFPTGSLVGRARVSEQVPAPEALEWNTLHALVDQSHIQAWVNGHRSVDYQDTTGLVAGKIGLQFREGPIRFRNIRIRPIGYSVLPKAKPSDWNQAQGDIQATFTDAGTILLKGGRGHVELLQPHANVCLQAVARTLVENVNSGIFFRCIPGEDMNGYECQIHHGFKEDRRRPVDAGSGAIFRRQNAKAVLSDENQPVHITIIADGNRFATWVEGVQVVQWEDTRAPNDNPRKGLRTEAGTIMLQGHDPASEVEFTSMVICPLP